MLRNDVLSTVLDDLAGHLATRDVATHSSGSDVSPMAGVRDPLETVASFRVDRSAFTRGTYKTLGDNLKAANEWLYGAVYSRAHME